MKNIIEQNYNMSINNLNEKDGIYSFINQNDEYLFVYFNRTDKELLSIINCSADLNQIGIKTLIIILNKNKKAYTEVNNQKYILLKLIPNYKDKVDLIDIIENNKKLYLNNKYQHLYRSNWAKLWSDKLDYYEYQINQLGLEKDIILDSYSYYEGLATNAIALVNEVQNEYQEERITLAHRRIRLPNYKLNYYNPLNFIFDLQVRDIAEYIKESFFKENNAIIDLKTFLENTKLTHYEYQMFYARLLYPSYYFDLYDQIMNNNLDSEQ